MRIRAAHVSLQFSDTEKQHTHDITKIFKRANDRHLAWLMGTEAGPGADNTSEELVRISREAGYRPWVPSEQSHGKGWATDCWIAVREDLIVDDWNPGYIPVIPGSGELYKERNLDPDLNPRWGPKGIVNVSFKSLPQVGEIGLAVAHHLTKGQRKGPESVIHGVDHWEWNEQLDDELGAWLAKVSKGTGLGFASMDRNASDRRNPANIPGTTTLADELKKYQNTGHGDIDWMLSVNKDGRVKGVNWVVLDDREFHLFSDHFYTEGTFSVEPLPLIKR